MNVLGMALIIVYPPPCPGDQHTGMTLYYPGKAKANHAQAAYTC